jgi:two-component system response regulator DevR
MIRVFLVDDHELVRRGIAGVIDTETDMEVVGESGTAKQARERVAATRPDVAVVDVQLPDAWGIDLCRDLLSSHPTLTCLILTAYDDDEAMSAAVLAGASGYVIKDIRAHGLIESIRHVAAGHRLLPKGAAARVTSHIAPEPASTADEVDLTLRERQVLKLIGEGLTNRQIGEHLDLAEKTVKNYVSGLLAKLGLDRRTQAAVYATHNPPM